MFAEGFTSSDRVSALMSIESFTTGMYGDKPRNFGDKERKRWCIAVFPTTVTS